MTKSYNPLNAHYNVHIVNLTDMTHVERKEYDNIGDAIHTMDYLAELLEEGTVFVENAKTKTIVSFHVCDSYHRNKL